MPVSLLDIAPPELATEEIDIRGTKLVLRGITNLEMAVLYKRFPVYAKMVAGDTRRTELLAMPKLTAGQAAELDHLTISPEDDLICNLEIAAPMIAAGLGELGNGEIEAGIGKRLTKAEQSAARAVVMRLTYQSRTPPATLVDFEAALVTLGFSEEKARVIAASGFKEDAGPLAPGADPAAATEETASRPQ